MIVMMSMRWFDEKKDDDGVDNDDADVGIIE